MKLYYLLNKGRFDTLRNVLMVVAETERDAKKLFEDFLEKEVNYCDIKYDDLEDLKQNANEIISGWDIFGEVTKIGDIISKINDKIFELANEVNDENYLKKSLEIINQTMLMQTALESLGVYYI